MNENQIDWMEVRMNYKKIFGNKKVVSVALAVALIAAVGVVNYKLTGGAVSADSGKKTEDTEQAEAVDVFSQYKNERTSRRAEEISYIDSVISGETADAQTKSRAEEQKLEIVSCMETELTTEGLIQTKMMVDTVVTVKDGAVNVVVNQDSLTEEEVAQIAEIVRAQTGEAAQNIKIMPQSAGGNME